MRALFSIAFVLLFQLLSAQMMFERTLSDSVSMSAQSAVPLPDGGYIACGATRGQTHYNAALIRLDSAGNIIWSKTYSSFVDLFGMDVQPVSTGGYILLIQRQQTTAYEAQVVRTDTAGNVLWQQSYGGPGDEEVKEITETSDGGFLISIQSNSYGFFTGATLIKTDNVGAVLWRKSYRGHLGAVGCSAKEVPAGGYVFTARIIDTTMGIANDIMVVRVDVNGNVIWSTTFGGPDSDEPYDIEVTSDNGCIVGGRLYNYGPGNTDVFLSRLDSAGNLLWTKTYGGPGFELTYDIDITSDGGVIVGGWTSSFSSNTNDYYIIRTDPNGDTLWTGIMNHGTNNGHFMWNIAETSDGGFMCSGEAYLNANARYIFYLVKTNSAGYSGCNKTGTPTTVTDVVLPLTAWPVYTNSGNALFSTAITVGNCTLSDSTYCTNVGITELTAPPNNISVYPCPATTSFTVQSDEYLNDAEITIRNATGQIVKKYSGLNGNTTILDCSDLASGIYFLSLTDHTGVSVTERLILAE